MAIAAKPDMAAEIAAALDWWRDAGVDCEFADAPANWLAEAEEQSAASAHAPRPRDGGDAGRQPRSAPGAYGAAERSPVPRREAADDVPLNTPAIDRAALPPDLAAFTAWWLSEPALDQGRASGRVPPRGRESAELMIIVPEPEREDGERLLSGPQGRLLDGFLAAAGVAPESVYAASILPRHTPMADWADVAARGFGAVLVHHVLLVRPRRIIAFGQNALPLLGHDPANSPAVLRTFNHEGATIPLLAGRSLAALLERPRWKAGLWQGWLDWTA